MPEILRYQRDRTLADVVAFPVGLQLRLPDGKQVYLALSNTELELNFSDDISLHYDLEGRFAKLVTLADYHRRALSGQVLLTRKATPESPVITRAVLGNADAVITRSQQLALDVCRALAAPTIEFAKPDAETALSQLRPLVERAAGFDNAAARAETERFRAIYRDVAILPPDQYNALVVQATEGCAYRGCLFCDLYRHRPFRAKTPDEFATHLDDIIAFHGDGLRTRRSIFLGEANALTLPHQTLVEMFNHLHQRFHFPSKQWNGGKLHFDGVSSFVDAFTRPPDFAALAELGLRRIYIGMETGNDELQRWLRKPADANSILALVTAAKSAGLNAGVILLLGAGGARFAASHVRESVRLLNSLPLGQGDYIYLSPLAVEPGSAYANSGVPLFSPEQVREQENAIRDGLLFDAARGKPYVVRYEIESFVY
jgi:hypothetical protein